MLGAFSFIKNYFPDSQGFNRTILFVQDQNENSGYYIIDDEIHAPNNYDSDIYFHGLGNRTISSQSVTWQIDNNVLNLTVLAPKVQITPVNGKVYQDTGVYTLTYGVKIQPINPSDKRVISLFYAHNVSYPGLTIKDISSEVNPQGLVDAWNINQTDYFMYPTSGNIEYQHYGTNQKVPFIYNNISFSSTNLNIQSDSHRLFFRTNSSGYPTFIYSYAKNLQYNGTQLYNYSQLTPLYTGNDNQNNQFKVLTNDNEANIPLKYITKSTPPPDTSSLTHPFLFFNSSMKQELENKINGTTTGPWKDWYDGFGSGYYMSEKAFKAYMDDNTTEINSVITELMGMANTLEPFKQNLHRGTYVCDYIVAYDILYNYMTSEQRQEFESEAFNITYPSALSIIQNVCPNNNHLVVSLVAYGLLGLVEDNKSIVQLMQDQIDHYLNNYTVRGGVGFEGPSYAEYTFKYATRFMFALKNVGGYNYYSDPNFIQVLNYTAHSRAPDGTHALFEDAHEGIELSSLALQSISQEVNIHPTLAKNLQWYVDQYDINDILESGAFYNIVMYNGSVPASEPSSGLGGSFIYFDGGIAGLGTGQKSNDTMLIISNKQYFQMHAHYDENSFELWCFGKKFLTNAGYPNYYSPGHSYTISTAGNNDVIINKMPQFGIESDGFSSLLVSNQLQVLSSPSYLTYENAYSFSHFPWYQIMIVISILSLVIAYTLSLRGKEKWREVPGQFKFHSFWERKLEKNSEKIGTKATKTTNSKKIKDFTIINAVVSLILQYFGFILLFYRSEQYVFDGIQQSEYYPDQLTRLHNYYSLLVIILSIITATIILLRFKFVNRLSRVSLISKEDKNDGLILKRKLIISIINVVFYIIWFIIMMTIVYPAILKIPVDLFTEGSTVENFLTQFSGVIINFWGAWLLMLIIRYFMLLVVFTTHSKFLKRLLVRDLARIILFSLFIIIGIFIAQNFSIESFNTS